MAKGERVEQLQKQQEYDAATAFERMYASAENNPNRIPWRGADANPRLTEWLDLWGEARIAGKRALVVGCGLGGDAEELSHRGFQVTAFDLSSTAIDWCKSAHPDSSVTYLVGDLFAPPSDWVQAWDFVLDVRIVQSMPLTMREDAISAEANLVAPDGHLLIITERRDDADLDPSGPPWPLSHYEIMSYNRHGLELVSIAAITDYSDRWRALFTRPKPLEAL